jgi:RNA polymerase sigma-70 factor (ECF subfamily)
MIAEHWGLFDRATLNVVFTMTPSPTWFSGCEDVRVHAKRMFLRPEEPTFPLMQTLANNQIAFACYKREKADGLFHAHALQVLTFENTQITEIHAFFIPLIFPRFSMPMVL